MQSCPSASPVDTFASWDPSRTGALSDVHVLDLSRFIAGPLCAQNLADMGADVIKVERLGGEDTRHNQPRYGDKSLYTAIFNRNKRAITLDTRSEDGQALLLRLAGWADVIVENFRPGTLAKMGLTRQALDEVNDDIIVVSISGFGQEGPSRDRALFDCIAQAMSGLMHLNAQPGGPPLLSKMFPADSLASAYATIGALTALYHRERTGQGQVVDLAVYDALVASLGTAVPAYLVNGDLPAQNGNRDDYNAPANIFPTDDGYVYLHAGTPAFWKRFCLQIINRPELVDDERYASVQARMARQDEVEQLVSDWTSTRPGKEVEAAFMRAEIPCAIVADIPTAAASTEAWERDILIKTKDDNGDPLVLLGNPVKLSETPTQLRLAPPQIGQHTDEVLADVLGLDDHHITALHKKGVV